MTPVPVRRPPGREVTGLAERAEAGRAARRARTLRRVARGLLLLVPVAVLAWVLLASTWLAVDVVQVVGQQRLSPAEVRQAAAVVGGTPLARVDTGAVQRRVEALTPVASARVTRSWPGTLRVEVTERTPAAGVVGPSGVRLVDGAGVVFAEAPALPAGLVRLQVDAPGPEDPATLAALRVHRDLPAELRARVRIVRAATATTVVLLTSDGRQVVWGSPGGTATKAAAALVLLRTDSQVVDVSAPGLVVTRGGSSPSPAPG